MSADIFSVKIMFRAKAKDIVLLNSVIDSYEGLALIRTDDSKDKNFLLLTTNNLYKEVLTLLEHLKADGLSIEDLTIEETENTEFN